MSDTIINGVVVKGKSYQFSTPGLEETKKRTITNLLNPTIITKTLNGITCTNNGDGTYTLNGTATTSAFFDANDGSTPFTLPQGEYRYCGTPNDIGASTSTVKSGLLKADASEVVGDDTGNGFTFQSDGVTQYVFRMTVYQGVTVDNVVIKPMVTTDLDATYDDFVQYSGDGDLNDNVAKHEKDITELRNSFSSALTDLKNTAIAQAVGAVGTTFTSVIAKLATIVDRKNWSANMDNTGSVTIPAGYHNGSGTVKTNGTASVTTNGTHNIAAYTSVTVNVQNDVKHSVVTYMKITQDSYRHALVGLIVDGVDKGAVEVGTYGSQQNLQYNGSTYSV